MDGKVYIIGGGPGDPELLTLKAKRIIESAERKAIGHFRSTEHRVSTHGQNREQRKIVMRGKIADADWHQLVKLRSFNTLWLYSTGATDADPGPDIASAGMT